MKRGGRDGEDKYVLITPAHCAVTGLPAKCPEANNLPILLSSEQSALSLLEQRRWPKCLMPVII